MNTITDFDMDLARDTREAIRAEIARNIFARELNAAGGTSGISARVDSILVRLGDRASTRQTRREGTGTSGPRISIPNPAGNGAHPQGR